MTLLLSISMLFSASGMDSGPFSVVDSFQRRVAAVSGFSASVERIQSCRGVKRIGKGTVLYDQASGCAYSWREPGKYLFVGNDTSACGIDLEKKEGWRHGGTMQDLATLREGIDPLFRFLRIGSVDRRALIYRGNIDDLLLFSMPLTDGKQRTAGFDAVTFQCRIAETFDSSGRIIEKIRFLYGKRAALPFPSEMVISEPAGDGVTVDSIVFKRVRINGDGNPDVFLIPAGVRWREWCGDALSEEQLDPVPGP